MSNLVWELRLLAQTLEFSDDVRFTLQQASDRLEKLEAEVFDYKKKEIKAKISMLEQS